MRNFCEWFVKQNYTHKIVVAGNHELTLCPTWMKEHADEVQMGMYQNYGLKASDKHEDYVAMMLEMEKSGALFL